MTIRPDLAAIQKRHVEAIPNTTAMLAYNILFAHAHADRGALLQYISVLEQRVGELEHWLRAIAEQTLSAENDIDSPDYAGAFDMAITVARNALMPFQSFPTTGK